MEAAEDYRVVTRDFQDNNTQRWVVTPIDDGSFTIRQRSTGQFVDAHEYDGMDFGLVTRPYQDNDTQRWLFDRENDS